MLEQLLIKKIKISVSSPRKWGNNAEYRHCKDPKNMTGKPIKKIKNKYSKVTHVFPLESYVWAPNDASEQDKDEILQTLKESKEKLREN